MCAITYSISSCSTCYGCSVTGIYLNTCSIDNASNKIKLYAPNANQQGYYFVTLRGTITGYSSRYNEVSFKVYVL